jgi:hypothetical protein
MDVISVSPMPEFKLELRYQNGERRVFDCKPLMAMKPWNRIATKSVFDRVKTSHGTVSWPGDIGVAPETLYLDSTPVPEFETKEKP